MARRRVAPVRSRRKDEKVYIALIRREVVEPRFAAYRAALAGVTGPDDLSRIETVTTPRTPPGHAITDYFVRLEGYHWAKTVSTFWAALRVDVRPFLLGSARFILDDVSDPAIKRALRARIDENVRLIGNVSDRTHTRLRGRIMTSFQKASRIQAGNVPAHDFRRLVSKAVHTERRTTMSSMRLIARDQTTKAIGALTEIRQTSLGLTQYRWLTQGDSDVRPTHAAQGGNVYDWASPPSTGHPGQDINCRCTAQAIIPPGWNEQP